MLEQAEESTTQRLVGQFESEADTQAALARLVELGIAPEAVTLTRVVADAPPAEDELPVDPLRSGAATGAVLGGLLGALGGWMLSIGALALPGVGRVEGVGSLSTLLAGLGLGALIGGLIGALIGVGIPKRAPSPQPPVLSTPEGPLYMTVEAPLLLIDSVETALIAKGALEVQGVQVPGSSLAHERGEGVNAQSLNVEPGTLSSPEEDAVMSDSDKGRDPNTVTGTTDAIDPETGTLGTGGTPLTTGYGVSGSTVGTGTSQGREESESGEPRRPTPDAATYDRGGRGSADEPDLTIGTEHSVPTEVKYGPVPGEDTSGEEMPQGGDLYTRGPSYGGESKSRSESDSTNTSPAERYSSSSPDEPPSYANIEGSQAQESAGTNIPGTEDPRGLGDNTDR